MKLLENDQIILRALEPEDLDVLYRWENDASLWETGSTLSPYSRFVLKEYIESAHQTIYATGQLRLMIELKETGETVGTIDLYDLDPHHRRCGVGILVDSSQRNKGVASNALLLVLTYAFSFLKLQQVYAHVPVKNHPSVSLFTRCGFVTAGKLLQWISTPSGFADVYVMQYLSAL